MVRGGAGVGGWLEVAEQGGAWQEVVSRRPGWPVSQVGVSVAARGTSMRRVAV